MMNAKDLLVSIFRSFLAFFYEMLLAPLSRISLSSPQRKDEITINININTQYIRSSFRNPSSRPIGPRHHVKFGEIEIRTYDTILGDNPSCSQGPPLAIGWKYDPNTVATLPVDVFENYPSRKYRHRHHISEFDLLMDRRERETTLLHLGYTKAEIASATRQSLRDKKKRRQTTDNLGAIFAEEKIEGLKKSIRRNIMFKKGTKALYKKWKKVDENSVGSRHIANSILVSRREDGGDSVSTGTLSRVSEEISDTHDIAVPISLSTGGGVIA